MLDTEHDLSPPASSPAVRALQLMRESGEAIRLSINSKRELLVTDDESFQLLIELADRLDTIESLREALHDFDRGVKGISLEEAKAEALRKYGISL